MRCFLSAILVAFLGIASAGHAAEDEPDSETKGGSSSARAFDPPGIDYPATQALGIGTSLYVDQTYESTSDLSTFTWVTGHGDNFRLSVGGTLQIGELRLAAEVPVQYTRLHIDTLQGMPTADQDRDKATLSLGDVITGAAYLWTLPVDAIRLQVGPTLRARLPTHTTQFAFTLTSGYIFTFGFPYYLHLAPGLVLLASTKFLTIRIEETLLSMLAVVKDVTFDGIPMSIPNLFFWESHYAAIAQPLEWFGFSVELVSCLQLNRVDDSGYTTLHNVKALMLEGGPALDFGSYRASVVGRFGLTHGSQDFGVITFSGTKAVMGRLSYVF
jgi:hypothetical protein